MQRNHVESTWSACSSNIWMQTDGWSRQAQAHEICKSVLFAQLQILFSNFIWHGVIWTIHSGAVSLVYLDGTQPQTNKVYHRAFDLNQKYSKYLGSASNHQRGCQNFPPIIQGRHMCGSSLNAKLSRHRWVQWLENTFQFNRDSGVPVRQPDQNC